MEICVVGAGIVGLSSAWFLHKAGHNVTAATAVDPALLPGIAKPTAQSLNFQFTE